MTASDFARVISQIESDGRPDAIGDSGQAITSYQAHPCWTYEWGLALGIIPGLRDTWESYVGALVAAFFRHQIRIRPPIQIAMFFHVGHACKAGDVSWDAAYAARFVAAAAKLGVS